MKRVLLHVGLPKTGTTSIQDLLAAAAPDLEHDGVLFPVVREDLRAAERARGVGKGWHLALATFVANPDKLAAGEWEAWRAAFRRFADTPALTTLVLSQEGLLASGRRERIAALMAEIPAGERRIVLALRPAHAWLTSLYEQFVRSVGRTAEVPGAFRQALSYADEGFEGLIARVARMVPNADVDVLSFDALLAGEGLLANFAAALALPPWLAERARAAPRANPGLPQDMVALLRAANAAGIPMPRFVAIRAALARAARRRTGVRERGQIFPPELALRIADRYAADRAFVRERFGVELPAAPPLTTYTPLACDAEALRSECAAWLAGENLAVFDAVARSVDGAIG